MKLVGMIEYAIFAPGASRIVGGKVRDLQMVQLVVDLWSFGGGRGNTLSQLQMCLILS
jgi:hypothetical protein